MKISRYKKKVKEPLRQTTLCFLINNDEILLAMKKRGFGKDRQNGVGGKPNPNEVTEKTTIREVKEEISVTPKNIEVRAVLDFYFPHHPDWSQRVIVYFSENWDGEPMETEEMLPKWYKKDQLPFDSMWPDDKHWLPKVLSGSKLKAEFMFGENDTILDFNVIEVDSLDF